MAGTARTLVRDGRNTVLRGLSDRLPNTLPFNWCIAAVRFAAVMGRLPRGLDAADAMLNDYLFHIMIRDCWDDRHRRWVDKERAKASVAGRCSMARVSRTLAVHAIDEGTSEDELRCWLLPFRGTRAVAKPTHSSGAILFLDRDFEPGLRWFLNHSRRDYFRVNREVQYHGLPRKILIEENIAVDGSATDYKFFCFGGRPLFCQVDVDRFGHYRRSICSVPGFEALDLTSNGTAWAGQPVAPAALPVMMTVAEELAAGFDFVRVDLYDTPGGVYFGELTFTPGAGMDHFSSKAFATRLLRLVPGQQACERPPAV